MLHKQLVVVVSIIKDLSRLVLVFVVMVEDFV